MIIFNHILDLLLGNSIHCFVTHFFFARLYVYGYKSTSRVSIEYYCQKYSGASAIKLKFFTGSKDEFAMWSILALSFGNILTTVSRLPCAVSTYTFMTAVLMRFRLGYSGFMNFSSVIDWAQQFSVEISCLSRKSNVNSFFSQGYRLGNWLPAVYFPAGNNHKSNQSKIEIQRIFLSTCIVVFYCLFSTRSGFLGFFNSFFIAALSLSLKWPSYVVFISHLHAQAEDVYCFNKGILEKLNAIVSIWIWTIFYWFHFPWL